MTQRGHDERASVNTFQAAQHVLGLNIVDIARWLWIGLASSWLWTAQRADGHWLPEESPLEWLHRVAGWAGWTPSWPIAVESWLGARPDAFWPLIGVGAVAISWSIRSGWPYTSVALLALLAAVSVAGAAQTLTAFLIVTALFCLLGVVGDLVQARLTRHASHPTVALPQISFERWARGPAGLLASIALAPVIALVMAIAAYRLEPFDALDDADLGDALDDLSDVALSQASTGEALAVLARAILLAQEAEQRPRALRMLRYRQKLPSGARVLVRRR